MHDVIEKIEAREILGGSGRPTVEVKLTTREGIEVEASVSSGTSKGRYEAFELYDGGKRYRGFGVLKAVENIRKVIAPGIEGMDVTQQWEIDNTLIQLDGTDNKRKLGANAILPVSVACAKAGAASCKLPCFRYLGGLRAERLPAPMATVFAGGVHSSSSLEFEDYLLILAGFSSFLDAVEALVETRYILGTMVRDKFGPVAEIGGALAPPIKDTRQAFDLMLEAVERAGFSGKVTLGLDVAANEFYLGGKNLYQLAEREMKAEDLNEYYLRLTKEYPLTYIEDPFHQDDYFHFAKLTQDLPEKMIVGDDLFASNPGRIAEGIRMKAGNAVLLKINQIGTVSEALDAAHLAARNHFRVHVSLRSNETNDDFIADLAVAVGAKQIKLGSPLRGEKTAKYNRLSKIEHELGGRSLVQIQAQSVW